MAFDIAPYGQAITETASLLHGILNRVLPEKMSEETGAKLEQELTLSLVQGDLAKTLGQLAINAEEAKSDNFFIAGWRPGVGWTCVAALSWTFVIAPFCVFWLGVLKITTPPLPTLDYATLSPILLGLLGLGGLRTYEKVKGVATTPTGK